MIFNLFFYSPIFLAVEASNPDIVKILVSDLNININQKFIYNIDHFIEFII